MKNNNNNSSNNHATLNNIITTIDKIKEESSMKNQNNNVNIAKNNQELMNTIATIYKLECQPSHVSKNAWKPFLETSLGKMENFLGETLATENKDGMTQETYYDLCTVLYTVAVRFFNAHVEFAMDAEKRSALDSDLRQLGFSLAEARNSEIIETRMNSLLEKNGNSTEIFIIPPIFSDECLEGKVNDEYLSFARNCAKKLIEEFPDRCTSIINGITVLR